MVVDSLSSPKLVSNYSVPTICVRNLHSIAWNEDEFLKSLESQKSQNPHLNRTRNRENIMKYFGVDLEAKCSPPKAKSEIDNSALEISKPPEYNTKVKQIAKMFNEQFSYKNEVKTKQDTDFKRNKNKKCGPKSYTSSNPDIADIYSVKEKIKLFNQFLQANRDHNSSFKSEDLESSIITAYEPGTVKYLAQKFESRCKEMTASDNRKSVAVKRTQSAPPIEAEQSTPAKKSHRAESTISKSCDNSPTAVTETNLKKSCVTVSSSTISSTCSTKLSRRSRAERKNRRFFDNNRNMARFYDWIEGSNCEYDQLDARTDVRNQAVQVDILRIDQNTQTNEEIATSDKVPVNDRPVHRRRLKAVSSYPSSEDESPISMKEQDIVDVKYPRISTQITSTTVSVQQPTTVELRNDLNFVELPNMNCRRKSRRAAAIWKDSSSDSESNYKSVIPGQKSTNSTYITNDVGQDASINLKLYESRARQDSLEDQGFETGSNGVYTPDNVTEVKPPSDSPLFVKMPAPADSSKDPSARSTPFKADSSSPQENKSQWHSILSPVELPQRRSSIYSLNSRQSFGAPLNRINENQQAISEDKVTNADKFSLFWISSGRFRVSTSIFYNAPDRLSLLYEIFSEKMEEGNYLYFGIDNCRYCGTGSSTKIEIRTKLRQQHGRSHYWFATGDLAVPFNGKYLAPEKVSRMFDFIRESASTDGRLSFGVDDIEFSKFPDTKDSSRKFSIESGYSMLIGLSGRSDGFKDEYVWPRSNRKSINATQDSHSFSPDGLAGRLSFTTLDNNLYDFPSLNSEDIRTPQVSPDKTKEHFDAKYSNESLESIFTSKINHKPIPKEYFKLLHNTMDNDCESTEDCPIISCDF